ncbi:SPOSA6832_02576 [Sporobolomyces salmonicolor]|uniref:Large ribosomal subunit protein uL11m n=1 Tax=Sporidiobolus salmonicolor TaxID=5005 RepID=A0A0D6ELP9_SPOSA|nr:SPOSA6832_02576 [Sporobolomyces salmonicolor]
MSKPAAAAAAQIVRLVVPAGKATASPPVGPALGARGVKSIDFVKEFNGACPLPLRPAPDAPPPLLELTLLSLSVAPPSVHAARTSHLTPGTPTPVLITIQPDRTFTFVTKTPPTSWLIKQAAAIELGSGEAGKPGAAPAGTLTMKHVYEIAKIKQRDEHLRAIDLEAIAKSVVGSCKSAGVAVVP